MVVDWFRRYLMPAFVFQSIIIAGGYGTGRELVEFFLHFGPLGGLLAMIPATLLTSVTCLVAFELARVTRSYDYRSFVRQILGRGWFLYEIGYMSAVLLILSVIGSASGIFLSETFGLPSAVGVIGLLLAIGVLVFKGTHLIEGVLSVWSFVLYAGYLALFLWSLSRFGTEISANMQAREIHAGWALSGVRYAALQISLVPAILFATTHIKRRREAVVAGMLAGPVAMIPALLFFVVMVGQYPLILERPVPVNYVLELLGSRTFHIVFLLILFGTLIETGTGLIHAFNERLAGVLEVRTRRMPKYWRPATAVILLGAASLLSRVGIVALIGKGYMTMTWFFMAIFVVPLLTIGIRKIRVSHKGAA